MKWRVEYREKGTDKWVYYGRIDNVTVDEALQLIERFAFVRMAERVFEGDRVLSENMRCNEDWRLVEHVPWWRRVRKQLFG